MCNIVTDLYHDLLTSVVAALEVEDNYTAEHSLRVSDMVELACRLLGLEDEETEKIHMAAHVHDIGKIGVPGAVIAKHGPLNEEEWALMRQHPRIGADMLGQSMELSEIADIVLHHHERWDGKGYPDGLKGLEIPFGSRIIAICDSIDAMLSQRPYRKTISPEECRKEILKNSGNMYDPDIVKVVCCEWKSIIKDYS